MSDIFQTITGDDWKRSIAERRSRKNKVADQIRTLFSAPASGAPLVAVLCVAPKSIYKRLAGVECYDQARDVRTFAGGIPVVAHPPCRAWSAKCAHQAKPEPGEKDLGPLCVEWLRKCGGVLEHPANSRLFTHCALPRPGEARDGLWTIAVSQAWWGHEITKHTWLCFAHIAQRDVHIPLRLHNGARDHRIWQLMSRARRSHTPQEMAEWLCATARLANGKAVEPRREA